MTASIDHLVVAAATLTEGRAWVEHRLGVAMTGGGRHPQFGTHNALLGLGPDTYLEVIAVDPDADPPGRPRWFALDDARMQARLAAGPALIHWVIRVDQLAEGPGVLELTRDEHRWRLTVPADGSLPMDGAAPSLIEWLTPPPPERLPENGVRLERLQVSAPGAASLRDLVRHNDVRGPVVVSSGDPGLRARLVTPHGAVDI